MSHDQKDPESSAAESVVEVRDVSKTYCRNLRRSLWYGIQDIFRELTFRGAYSGELRTEEFQAVREASFEIGEGECVALLGPNGAGKSSMLKMINGILRPNSGSIRIRGRVGALIELGTGFNPILSGRENVFINASVLGFSREETEARFDEILDFAEIGEFIDAPVQSYSSGMKVRLGFAVASHLAPDLLLIDEVLAVGDLAFRMKCYEHLQKRVESGMSVILVSHIVAMMPRFCTRSIVFDKGAIVFDGDIMEGIAEYQRILGIEKAKLNSIDEDDYSTTADESSEGQDSSSITKPLTQIESVSTYTSQREPTDTFSTDDAIAVEITIRSDVDLKNCKLVVNLDSSTFGLITAMASARQKFTFDVESRDDQGRTRVWLLMKQVPLIEGAYFFNVSLFGEGKNSLLDQKNALGPFRILNKSERRKALKGVLVIDHAWNEDFADTNSADTNSADSDD